MELHVVVFDFVVVVVDVDVVVVVVPPSSRVCILRLV